MLGAGVYKLSEAARYIGSSPTTLRSWFMPRSDRAGRGPLFKSDYSVLNGEYAISFLNLIDAKIARLFRTKGVRPSVIRRAYQVLGREMNTPHPFAHASLATDGRAILQRTADDVGSDEWIDVISKQRWFTEMSDCLSKIEYGADRMAARWNIAQGVQIDPSLSLGKPVIRQTGVATYVIAAQYRANNGDVALVADLFGLSTSQVGDAVAFEAGLQLARAA